MCLILFAYQVHPDYPLILAANRDEFYIRPTAPLQFWQDSSGILAGKDLEAGGTWLGITRRGRWAAVTNYRDPRRAVLNPLSRGRLVSDYLAGRDDPETFLKHVQSRAAHYNGFSLLLAEGQTLFYYCNQGDVSRRLSSGTYGLSNHLLDTPWPKVVFGKRRLKVLIVGHGCVQPADLLPLLTDRRVAEDRRLPDTGVGMERERMLSPVFITSPDYGTRSSSVLTISRDGNIHFVEMTWPRDGSGPIPEDISEHRIKIDAPDRLQ